VIGWSASAYPEDTLVCVILFGPPIAGLVIWKYRNTEKGRVLIDTFRGLWEGFWILVGTLLVAGLLLLGTFSAYQKWYPHTARTLVYTNGNWMQSEQRDSVLFTQTEPYNLDCTVKDKTEEPHQFEVEYTGADPTDQKDKPQHWTCTRTGSISCKE